MTERTPILQFGTEAAADRAAVRARDLKPYRRHRLSDIAQNHAEKIRRLGPLVSAAEAHRLALPEPLLRATLGLTEAMWSGQVS